LTSRSNVSRCSSVKCFANSRVLGALRAPTGRRGRLGDRDYLLHVVAADLAAYQRIYDEHLGGATRRPRLTSTLVTNEVVHGRGLPLAAR
jgi:hypothetical protein